MSNIMYLSSKISGLCCCNLYFCFLINGIKKIKLFYTIHNFVEKICGWMGVLNILWKFFKMLLGFRKKYDFI